MNNHSESEAKYLVTTRVNVTPGSIDEVLDLFIRTNPELVKDQIDWIKAIFAADQSKNMITVHAFWKREESYLAFRESREFQEAMDTFRTFFTTAPSISIQKILFTM